VDKTLALVTPPETPKPASQTTRTASKVISVKISDSVTLQKLTAPTAPVSAALDIKLSANGNSSAW